MSDGEGNDGQLGEAKHLCIAAPESDPLGKTGMVYAVPNQIMKKLGEISDSSEFVITGAHLVRNNDLADRIVLGSIWSVEPLKSRHRRTQLNSLTVFGTQTVIVARVAATDSAVSYSASDLQTRYFGTDSASVALQYAQCSAGQYALVPAANTNGVVDLSWNFVSNGVDVQESSIENSLRVAFESSYGSPENYGHVIYCLPSGFNGFRGYTYPNTNEIWLYDNWCGYLSLPFHEVSITMCYRSTYAKMFNTLVV